MKSFQKQIELIAITLRRILSNKSNRDKIKICYKKTFCPKRLNDTYLSHFTNQKGTYLHSCALRVCFHWHPWIKGFIIASQIESRGKIVWVPSLDINSNTLWPGFLDNYPNYLSIMTHLPISHHGTKGNWNSKIMSQFVNPSHWLVLFGQGNPYCHPQPRCDIRNLKQRQQSLNLHWGFRDWPVHFAWCGHFPEEQNALNGTVWIRLKY